MPDVITMTALGSELPCHGCGQKHRRGSAMTAIPYADGDPAGWFCPDCTDKWRRSEPMPNARPKRIQRKRTKGWRKPEGAIYIGRPSRWANPCDWRYYVRCGLSVAGAKAMAVDRFRAAWHGWPSDLAEDKRRAFDWMREHVHELRGHDLMDWCALDEACHGDPLLAAANAPAGQEAR